MPAKFRAILLLGLVTALAGLFIFLSNGDPPEERGISRKKHDPNSGHPTAAAGLTDEALPSKSKPRSPTPKISKARTLALLETPIPGQVEFPEHTLPERVAAINQWIRKAGIHDEQLRMAVEVRTAASPFGLNGVFERLALQDPTPATILKYTAGRTRLCFHIRAGVVEFVDATFTNPSEDGPVGDDPFAE